LVATAAEDRLKRNRASSQNENPARGFLYSRRQLFANALMAASRVAA